MDHPLQGTSSHPPTDPNTLVHTPARLSRLLSRSDSPDSLVPPLWVRSFEEIHVVPTFVGVVPDF